LWEIIDNILEVVQDRDVVVVEDLQEIMYGLSNGMFPNDLE